jgi:hypothetical protein
MINFMIRPVSMDKILFAVGDLVKHIKPTINNGLQMCIEDVRIKKGEAEYQCSYFLGKKPALKTKWFKQKDLKLKEEIDGGFFQL